MKPPTPEGRRLIAFACVVFWLVICVPLFWANDAWGYLAAGQRLNAGHELYALGSGDIAVQLSPPYWSSPFLYPPLWGIVWRLGASPAALALWMAVVTVAMLWWALRARWWLVAVLSPSFGVLLASGNVAGLFLVAFSLIPRIVDWRAGMDSNHRRRFWRPASWPLDDRLNGQMVAGVLVGAMAAIKLFPVVLVVWFVATRRWEAVRWAILTGAVLTLGAFLYDPSLTWTYLRDVIPTTKAMGIAPAALLGIPSWTTWIILAACVVVTIWRRSYAAAVIGVVLGSPAVGVAGLAMLGATVPRTPGSLPSWRAMTHRSAARSALTAR